MAITQALTTDAKLRFLRGEHLSGNVYKIALYVSAATLDATTTAYSATNEVSGTGYTAGGVTLATYASATSGTTAFLDWADAQWTSASFTARGATIYNSSVSNAVVAVLDFGSDKTVTSGTFTIQFPAADATNAIIRIA